MVRKYVSGNVIRRLPKYYRKLVELSNAGIQHISSVDLGRLLGSTASQIRQDLSHFGGFGQQGYGYNTEYLSREIARLVGMNQGYRAILVGAGNIGRALIEKFQFDDWGFQLDAAFDVDPKVIGTEINRVMVLDMDSLESYLHENAVDVAVLCVPMQEAVKTADRLIRCGIEAIWNFTNMDIVDPYSDVLVENIHFSDSLLNLSYYLSERKNGR